MLSGPVIMPLSSRSFWRSVLAFILTFPLLCNAQAAKPRFAQPTVELTTGEVVGVSTGDTQLQGLEDILYVEKPTAANFDVE